MATLGSLVRLDRSPRNGDNMKNGLFHRQTAMGLFTILLSINLNVDAGFGQVDAKQANDKQQQESRQDNEDVTVPSKIDVAPLAKDPQIQQRLSRILEATRWFENTKVEVDEGIVFLNGQSAREEHRTWAGDLARNTQDVVAVVNRISISPQPIWDFKPARREIESIGRSMLQSLPVLLVGLVVSVLGWLAARMSFRWARYTFENRFVNRLLSDVLARTVAVVVFLFGLHLALRLTGLTQIAATLLGGTGLIGLVIGIAFRDIAENFLASILISVQRPFALGDQIRLDGHEGIVQSVTMRGTLLMTLDGYYVQIPNSAVYKSTICNLTANPNQRLQFDIGIGYKDSISVAQELILQVAQEHEAVLSEPEPSVLAESLKASSVNLRVFFWIDAVKHSPNKVRSALIRLSKRMLQSQGMTLPGEVRELLVPHEIPIRMLGDLSMINGQNTIKSKTRNSSGEFERRSPVAKPTPKSTESVQTLPAGDSDIQRALAESTKVSTEAEGSLESEAIEIDKQSKASQFPEQGTNLLAKDVVAKDLPSG